MRPDPRIIKCVGMDDRLHVCWVDQDVCKCGEKVKRKKLQPNDHKLFSCYACTY